MILNAESLSDLLEKLIENWENEVVEFKSGKDAFSSSELGRYVSALANEANLRGHKRAWLVFGVDNKHRSVIGTRYKENAEHLQADKHNVRNGTGSFTFREIHVLPHVNGRVILFEIPAAPKGIPIAWNGHVYGRAGESLVALGQDKVDEIRAQTLASDWSAQIVEGATLVDLDTEAIATARERFAIKHANRISAGTIAQWSDTAFLDRAKVTQDGKITRTALLLLGKPESAWRLSPHPAEITWKLEGEGRAYEHFYPPFLLSTSKVFSRIRNIQLRVLPDNQLLAFEVAKYDQLVVLEALHNCIIHQDYRRSARIVVIEQPDKLILESVGEFFEGQPEDYVLRQKVPHHYRNPFLAQAMTELNMVDHMGYGIQDIYSRQRQRFFPLPDYDFSDPEVVRLSILGHIVDPAYSSLLIQKTDLPLADVLALDRVQKKLPIANEAAVRLKRLKMIEGRKPNFHVAAVIAEATDSKADYIRYRALDDEFYTQLLMGYLKQFGQASRTEIDELLIGKLSDFLTPDQKRTKVSNLITKLKRSGLIFNSGSRKRPKWQIAE